MKKTEKKVITITLVMVMLWAMLMPSISSAATGEVTIKDSKLKEAIVEQADINKDGIITQEEMKILEHVQIPEGVTDLTGLEYATNLRRITIKYNEIMPDLSKVNLGVTDVCIDVSDVTGTVNFNFLKSVKNLGTVEIWKEPETKQPKDIDYSALSEIKTLTSLCLDFGVAPKSIKDLGCLDYLLNLEITDREARKRL